MVLIECALWKDCVLERLHVFGPLPCSQPKDFPIIASITSKHLPQVAICQIHVDEKLRNEYVLKNIQLLMISQKYNTVSFTLLINLIYSIIIYNNFLANV